MPSPPRIAVVGSLVTDLTTFTDVFPRAGETLFGKSFDLGFGGKGANQAVAARLCGADVMIVGKVGRDLFGDATIKNLASFGIDTTHVHFADGVSTGVAPIFVEPGGQNRIIVVKGANDTLTPADVDAAAADLNSSFTPAARLYDARTYFLQSLASATWQQSARMSYTVGGSAFLENLKSQGLSNAWGYTFNASMKRRLSKNSTLGANYVRSHFEFPAFSSSGFVEVCAVPRGR